MTKTAQDVFNDVWKHYLGLAYTSDSNSLIGPPGMAGDICDAPERFAKAFAAATPKQEKCPYCHEDVNADTNSWVGRVGRDLLDDAGISQVYVSIEHPGYLIAVGPKGTADTAPIKYCPICGRKLEDGE